MSELENYLNGLTILFAIVMVTIFIGCLLVFALIDMQQAHGQDIDPRFYCLYANIYPYSELCEDQRHNEILEQLLEKTKRFNAQNNKN